MASGKIRVLLIEDHPAIGEALGSIVKDKMDIELIGHEFTAEEGIETARKEKPDVAVVDISLGDAHGLDVVNNLKIQVEDVHVVVYSMYDDTIYAERALRSGASGYLMKSEPLQHLIEAIRTVAEGDIYLSRRMSSRILGKVAMGKSSNPMFAVDELTDREMAVFQMLGEGCAVDTITDKLSLSRKTVETYRRRVKEKLGLDSIEELLQYAIEWNHGHISQKKERN